MWTSVGLDISHGCYRGSYGNFDALRCLWAQFAGYGVIDFGGQGGPLVPNIDFDVYTEGDMLGEWPEGAPDDPLIILLVHDEKGGRIKNNHCRILADRLEDLEQRMHRGHAVNPSWILLTQTFIQGLRFAAHSGEDVILS